MKHRALPAIAVLAFACGGEPLDPADFDIDGTWGGDFISSVWAAPVTINFAPREKKGTTQRYELDGTLFDFRNARIIGEAEFDPATSEILIEVFLGLPPFEAMKGTVDGSIMSLTEAPTSTPLCFCSLTMIRDNSGANP